MIVIATWLDAHPIASGCINITFSVIIVFAVNALINYRRLNP